MAVTIIGKGKAAPEPPPEKPQLHPQVKADQIEVFGRLRLTQTQIAAWYGLTVNQVQSVLRRPDMKAAYDKGRSEAVVAIRQKQLQLALAGDIRMLLHAGEHFGDQQRGGAQPEVEDFEPGRFSWDQEMKRRVQAAREELLGKGAGAEAPGSE